MHIEVLFVMSQFLGLLSDQGSCVECEIDSLLNVISDTDNGKIHCSLVNEDLLLNLKK